jgi:hypothetical protein
MSLPANPEGRAIDRAKRAGDYDALIREIDIEGVSFMGSICSEAPVKWIIGVAIVWQTHTRSPAVLWSLEFAERGTRWHVNTASSQGLLDNRGPPAGLPSLCSEALQSRGCGINRREA